MSSGGAPIGNRLTAQRYNDTKLCYEYWNVTSIAIFDLCTFDSATANTVGFPNGGVFKPLAFSSLPGCTSAYEGMTQAINDAALGAGPTWAQGTVVSVGAGTGHVLVFCNGTNWVTAQNDVKPIHSVPHWNEPPEAEENYANI